MQDLDSERRKLGMVQRQLREVEGSSSAAAVKAGEVAALRETNAALTADLKVLITCPYCPGQCTHYHCVYRVHMTHRGPELCSGHIWGSLLVLNLQAHVC